MDFQSSPERATLALPLLGAPANHTKNPAEFKRPSGAPPSPGLGRSATRPCVWAWWVVFGSYVPSFNTSVFARYQVC